MPDLSPVEDRTVAETDELNPHRKGPVRFFDKNMLEKPNPPVGGKANSLFLYLLCVKVVFCAGCDLLKTDNPLLYPEILLILTA